MAGATVVYRQRRGGDHGLGEQLDGDRQEDVPARLAVGATQADAGAAQRARAGRQVRLDLRAGRKLEAGVELPQFNGDAHGRRAVGEHRLGRIGGQALQLFSKGGVEARRAGGRGSGARRARTRAHRVGHGPERQGHRGGDAQGDGQGTQGQGDLLHPAIVAVGAGSWWRELAGDGRSIRAHVRRGASPQFPA